MSHLSHHLMRLTTTLFFAAVLTLSATSATQAAVVDDTMQPTDGVIISEIYQNDHGSFIEFYNNSDHDAYGWHQFFLNPHTFGIDLPNFDLPPLFDLSSIKPHGTKSVKVNPIWAWSAINYFKLMGNDVLTEVQDALDEQPDYSYQRCLTYDADGQPFISDKFYYAKATRGVQLDCASLSLTDQTIYNQPNQCHDIKFDEIYSNAAPDQQFIEVQNTGTTPVDLSACYLSTDHITTPQPLGNTILLPQEQYAVGFPYQTTDPNWHALGMAGGHIKLLTTNQHAIVDELTYHGQQPNRSYSLDDNCQWQFTLPTPNAPNQFTIESTTSAKPETTPAPITKPTISKPRSTGHSTKATPSVTPSYSTDNTVNNDDLITLDAAPLDDNSETEDQLAQLNDLTRATTDLLSRPTLVSQPRIPSQPDIWPAKAFVPPLSPQKTTPSIKAPIVKATPARQLPTTQPRRQSLLRPTTSKMPKAPKATKAHQAKPAAKPTKTCPEGSQLNPATNRCVKSTKLDHQPATSKSDTSSTTPPATSDYSLYIIGAGLGIMALIVAAYQIAQARRQVKLRRSAQVLSPTTSKLTEPTKSPSTKSTRPTKPKPTDKINFT